MRRKNDILLKSAFEESFPDLLRFFFKKADQIFDLERGFEFMDKELNELFPEIQSKGGSRFVDMLAKTYLKNGIEKWILIHIEIQDKNDHHFATRMFQYFYRIYDRYNVPVTALAVFTGKDKKHITNCFNYNFLGTSIKYGYNAYHILDHSEEQLLGMNNPFALVILSIQKSLLFGKIPDKDMGNQRLMIARTLIQSRKYDQERMRRFLFFLKTFLYIENPEINLNFDKEIDLITNVNGTMGIIETIKMITREEGLEEGRKKGREEVALQKNQEFVKNLLLNTDFDIAKIAALSGTSLAFVKQVKKDIRSQGAAATNTPI